MSRTGRHAPLNSIHSRLMLSDIQHVEAHWKEYDCIVSICQPFEVPRELHSDPRWKHVAIDDAQLSNPKEYRAATNIIRTAAKTVEKALRRGESVLLHCAAGQNRSVAVAVAIALRDSRTVAAVREHSVDAIVKGIAADKLAAGFDGMTWRTLTNRSFWNLLEEF